MALSYSPGAADASLCHIIGRTVLSRAKCPPLLPLDLGCHLGVEGVVEGGGQRAQWRGHHGLGLVDVQDLAALGEALRGGDETTQPGRQGGGRRPVRPGAPALWGRAAFCGRTHTRTHTHTHTHTDRQKANQLSLSYTTLNQRTTSTSLKSLNTVRVFTESKA